MAAAAVISQLHDSELEYTCSDARYVQYRLYWQLMSGQSLLQYYNPQIVALQLIKNFIPFRISSTVDIHKISV